MVDIPPRLSEHQQFMLAVLADEDGMMNVTSLSRELARAYDNDGDRIYDRKKSREEATGLSAQIMAATHSNLGRYMLSPMHNQSFSQSLDRLADRDLVKRKQYRRKCIDGEWQKIHTGRTNKVCATDHGKEAGRELRQRHNDGRYNLTFPTEPWEGELESAYWKYKK